RWAGVSFLMIVAGYIIINISTLRTRGIWALMPRPILIMALGCADRSGSLAWTDVPPQGLTYELRHRLLTDDGRLVDLYAPESRLLRWSANHTLNSTRSDATATLAARLLALTGSPRCVSLARDLHQPNVILAESAVAYSHCLIYNDHAECNGSTVIQYRRPDYFRMTWHAQDEQYEVWNDGGATLSSWSVNSNTPSPERDVESALYNSRRTCGDWPYELSRLLWMRHNTQSIVDLDRPKCLGVTFVNGVQCYEIRGGHPSGSI